MIEQLSTVIVKCFLLFCGGFIRGFHIQHLYLYCLSVSTKCLPLTSPNKYLFCKFDHPAVTSIIQYKIRLLAAGKWITSHARCIFIHCTQSCCLQFREYKQVAMHSTKGQGLACPRLESLTIKVRFSQRPHSSAHSNETNYHQVLKSDHISPADCS